MNMSNTPFTNIETCNSSNSSHEQHETQPATDTAAPTRLYYANAAYGVIPCNYVRQPILTTLDSPMKLQNNFQPGIPSKAVSTLLEILVNRYIGRRRLSDDIIEVSTLLETLVASTTAPT
jgi:hypothetical protein